MLRLTTRAVLCAVGIGVGTMGAIADPIYLASSYHTLYRIASDGGIESFTFDVALRTMQYDAITDTVYVFGDAGGSGVPATIYRLENAQSGTPNLVEYSVLSHQYGSATFVDRNFCGFNSGTFYNINVSDPANPVEQLVGETGLGGTAGCAYSPTTDTLYLTSYISNMLYTVDRKDATPTEIGALGVFGLDYDAEWYDNMLYLAVQNATLDRLEFGTVDVKTGAYEYLMTIADGVAATATGFAVIPEPTSVVLLGLLGLTLVGTRRR